MDEVFLYCIMERMNIFLYNFFHNETNDRTEKGLVNIPEKREDWPDAWKKISYKRYGLFPEIPLPDETGYLYKNILTKRRSSADFILGNNISLGKLSSILKCGYGLQEGEGERKENRTVPSGGRRFPLEIYILLFKDIEGCRSGIYHYGVRNHVLEQIKLTSFSAESIAAISPIPWIKDTVGMICMTGFFERTVNKYGSRGYRYILLEAGHAAQNMLLAGTENGVNLIPIGGVNENEIEKTIGLNSAKEGVVYALFF